MEEEAIFKALADASRRTLLDALFVKDGQSLNDLCDHLQMTRFGVMKHLQVLEEAGVITTQKVGREKYHYLNPVPIQMVYERWVGKYMQPWASTLTSLKQLMEGQAMSHTHILQIFIQTTPQRLWQALTESDLSRQYYFGSEVQSSWQPGSPYHYPNPAGGNFVEGEIIESDPPHKLVMSFRPVFLHPEGEAPASQVTWEIQPMGAACKLTLTHAGMDFSSAEGQELMNGWAQITSGLKTLLETGRPLEVSS
jgi:uncharacterized protein YndB with AHSA1/START domain/DNA-binding transcriptional ArsR family regulator